MIRSTLNIKLIILIKKYCYDLIGLMESLHSLIGVCGRGPTLLVRIPGFRGFTLY